MRKLVVRPPGPEGRFRKQWKWIPELRRLENAVHGAAVQVFDAIDEVSEEVVYEGIALEWRRAELHVVARESDGYLGFVHHRRLSVIPPNVSHHSFASDPMKVLSIFGCVPGIEEYETAHGLSRGPLMEVLEEIGLVPLGWERIGFVKESPPLGGVAHELFAVTVGSTPSEIGLEAGEEIDHVKFFPPCEVRNIRTICGLTQAALWRFRAWGLGQEPGTFWQRVASEL